MGGRHFTAAEDHLIRRFAGVVPAKEIAQSIRRTHRSTLERARQIGVSLMLRGERHHRAKYPDSTVSAALRLHDRGVPERDIAVTTGLPLHYLRRLVACQIRPWAGAP